MTRVQANHLKQLTRANQRLYEPQLSRSQEVRAMLSRGETQEQTAQALKQVGHASFSRASSIFPNEESTH